MVQTEKRRKLKEEHERALASLRATVRKPMSVGSVLFGDVSEKFIREQVNVYIFITILNTNSKESFFLRF